MSKRDARRRPALADWHLWVEVKRTITPLRSAPTPVLAQDLAEQPLPIPASKPPPVFAKGVRWSGPVLPAYQPPISRPRSTPGKLIEPRIKRRVTRGQIDIEATIDLHGMRQDEARAALQRFVETRASRGDRTLLVITGKGLKKNDDLRVSERGVLRAMLPVWLSEPSLAPMIAGWDAAAPGHGGDGAFYVRLRRVIR